MFRHMSSSYTFSTTSYLKEKIEAIRRRHLPSIHTLMIASGLLELAHTHSLEPPVCTASQLHLPDITSAAWNWLQWKYSHQRDWHMLQIRAFLLFLPLLRPSLASCWTFISTPLTAYTQTQTFSSWHLLSWKRCPTYCKRLLHLPLSLTGHSIHYPLPLLYI